MNDTVWITLWRASDGVVWNEVGSHTTQYGAQKAADDLRNATDLQVSIIEWRNSPFFVK
jgi:hypothetical protein